MGKISLQLWNFNVSKALGPLYGFSGPFGFSSKTYLKMSFETASRFFFLGFGIGCERAAPKELWDRL
jgi:hypothetical protein